jgi:hypothetical protein
MVVIPGYGMVILTEFGGMSSSQVRVVSLGRGTGISGAFPPVSEHQQFIIRMKIHFTSCSNHNLSNKIEYLFL